jgi:hypothetical protein
MPSEQEIQYHRSYLSYRYGDNFSERLKAYGPAAKGIREAWEIAEIREDDPEGYEEARKAVAALLRVQYIRPRETHGFRDSDYNNIKGQPSDGDVLQYLKPKYPPQGVVRNPTNGLVALPFPDVSIKAYRNGQPLLHTFMRVKVDQDFKTYATPWELEWSRLVISHSKYREATFTPIVDTSWTVIGYVGYVIGGPDCDLIVPVGIRDRSAGSTHPKDLLKREIPVFVGPGASPPPGWESAHSSLYGDAQVTYTVRTTIDGEVVAVLSTSSRDGAEPVWYSPADLLLFGKAVVSLVKIGAKMTPTLMRKSTAKLGARSVFKGPTKELADEVKQQATKKPPTVAPPVGPKPPKNLAALPLIKSPRLLAKHPGRITPEALREELKQKGFELAKEGNHGMQGAMQDSEIWVRKVPNPMGKGQDYLEAVRIDIRYRKPDFKPRTPVKSTGKPMSPGEVQAGDKPFRQRHHTLDHSTVKESEREAGELMNQGMRKEDLSHWHYERFPATQENLTEYLRTPAQGSGGPRILGLEKLDSTGKVVPNPPRLDPGGQRSAVQPPLPDPGGRR